MLEMLDVAIGFATVMLAVSLIVMSVTQALSSVLALRGAKLRAGLQQLIEQTAPTLAAKADEISEAMLKHPLISDASTRLAGRWQRASAIKKEELLPVLDAVLRERGLTLAVANERKALEEWFESFMTRVTANAKAGEGGALMKAYEDLLGTRLQSALDRSIDRAKTLQGQLSSAGIAIFPAQCAIHRNGSPGAIAGVARSGASQAALTRLLCWTAA